MLLKYVFSSHVERGGLTIADAPHERINEKRSHNYECSASVAKGEVLKFFHL
jgi:hypothetical protein